MSTQTENGESRSTLADGSAPCLWHTLHAYTAEMRETAQLHYSRRLDDSGCAFDTAADRLAEMLNEYREQSKLWRERCDRLEALLVNNGERIDRMQAIIDGAKGEQNTSMTERRAPDSAQPNGA